MSYVYTKQFSRKKIANLSDDESKMLLDALNNIKENSAEFYKAMSGGKKR